MDISKIAAHLPVRKMNWCSGVPYFTVYLILKIPIQYLDHFNV